ncbi:triadin [Hyalella azteca]|uniref:Triadin n=1 Tax=Hyalella azteca TaxID=294128 RepID=A0A8B7PNB4_HYAAZ|nr:triadin [Hyalella azteca]
MKHNVKSLLLLLLVASACASPIPQGSVASSKPKESSVSATVVGRNNAIKNEVVVEKVNATTQGNNEKAEPVTKLETKAEVSQTKKPEVQKPQATEDPKIVAVAEDVPSAGAEIPPTEIADKVSVEQSNVDEDTTSAPTENDIPIRKESTDAKKNETSDPVIKILADALVAKKESQKVKDQEVNFPDQEVTENTPVDREEAVTEIFDLRDEDVTDKPIEEAVEEKISSHTLFRSESVDDESDTTTPSPETNPKSASEKEVAVDEIETTTLQPEGEKEIETAASGTQGVRINSKNFDKSELQIDQEQDATTIIPEVLRDESDDGVTDIPVEEEANEEDVSFKFAAPIEIVEVSDSGASDLVFKDSAPIEIVEITETPEPVESGIVPEKSADVKSASDAEVSETTEAQPQVIEKVALEDKSKVESSSDTEEEATIEVSKVLGADVIQENSQDEDKLGSKVQPQEEEKPIASKTQPASDGDYWARMRDTPSSGINSSEPSTAVASEEPTIPEAEATTQRSPDDNSQDAVERDQTVEKETSSTVVEDGVKDEIVKDEAKIEAGNDSIKKVEDELEKIVKGVAKADTVVTVKDVGEKEIVKEDAKKTEEIIKEAEKKPEEIIKEAEKKPEEAVKEAEKKSDEAVKEAEKKPGEPGKEAEKKPEEAGKEAEKKPEEAVEEAEKKPEEVKESPNENQKVVAVNSQRSQTDPLQEGNQVQFQEDNSLQRRLV